MKNEVHTMTIGQRIKKLRRERNITQEQLAEYLNLSASAVSQWECDRVMPDISQLPLLANLFEVSADVLLGIDVDSKARRIEEIYQTALKTSQDGHREEAIAILRDGLRQYPDSFKLMDFLVSELWCRTPRDDETAQEIEAYHKQMETYLDKILTQCTDDTIRSHAVERACFLYERIGRYDDAIKLAESIPTGFTRRELLCQIYTGTKQYETKREDILSKFTNSIGFLTDLARSTHDDGTPVFTDDEKLALYEKEIAMFALCFDDGRYLYHAQFPEIAHYCCSRIHAERKNAEETLYHMEQAVRFAVEFDTMHEEDVLTSLLVRGIPDGGAWMEEHNRTYELLKDFAHPRYDFVREDTRFKEVVKKLKIYAK